MAMPASSARGERKGQWSIRVNDRLRVCLVWREGAAWDVEIVDALTGYGMAGSGVSMVERK